VARELLLLLLLLIQQSVGERGCGGVEIVRGRAAAAAGRRKERGVVAGTHTARRLGRVCVRPRMYACVSSVCVLCVCYKRMHARESWKKRKKNAKPCDAPLPGCFFCAAAFLSAAASWARTSCSAAIASCTAWSPARTHARTHVHVRSSICRSVG
jgi:hypothetical protein